MTGRVCRARVRAGRAALRLLAAAVLAGPALLTPTAPALAATATPSTPSTGATTASDDARAASTPDEQRAAVASWASQDGLVLVRQAVGADARISVGDPVAVRAWNESAADDGGSDPTTSTDDWAVSVTVDGAATAVLLVSATGSAPVGQLVQDADVARAVAGLTNAHGTELIRSDDGAWYLLADSTVTAVGTAARAELAGPVEVGPYLDVLRDRSRGDAGTTATTAPSSGSDWSVWATVAGVVLIGIGIIVITVRHERQVMAPLRDGVSPRTAVPGAPVRRAGATAVPTARQERGGGTAVGTGEAQPGGTEPVEGVTEERGASSTTAPETGAEAPRA